MADFDVGKREAGPVDFPPNKSGRHADTAENLEGEPLVDNSAAAEPSTKTPRMSPQASPSSASGSLYPPQFSGNSQQVLDVGEHDDLVWENDVADYIEPEDMVVRLEEDDDSPADEGRPPQMSAEELEALDAAAGYEEITRLLEMNVIKDPTEEDLQEGVVLSTRSVVDWLFREQRLFLLIHCILGLAFVDIGDAFLQVPQRETNLVEKPSWWSDDSNTRCWVLEKCLPGQRNAAACFYEFLMEHLEEVGFETTWLLPSLFRHKTRKAILCSHVDDLVLCGERRDLEWLLEELKKKCTLQGGDVLPSADQDDHEPIRFLKKRRYFTKAGIVISPHEKYTEELINLYGLQARKPENTMILRSWIKLENTGLDRLWVHYYTSAKIKLIFKMVCGI
eukprot:s3453_g10.t1